MEIDITFPTKLDTVFDAPEPLRSVLGGSLPPEEPARLLVHSPSFPAGEEKSPATVLAVTNHGWLVASETEDGATTLEKSDFSDTLFLKLTSILLLGQLRISFAAANASSSVTIRFEGVGDELYREAIDLMLAGIDPASTTIAEKDRNEVAMFENWPMKFRNEARRYWPKGQRLLAALRWPAICEGSQREIAPAGALLVTERELVLISDEKESAAEPAESTSGKEPKERLSEHKAPATEKSPETASVPVTKTEDIDPRNLPGDVYEFGEIITFVPRVRLAEFAVSHEDRFGVLTLQVQAGPANEKLEIFFPADHEKAVSKAMELVALPRSPAT
jgi:hypothetical protein